MVDVMRRARQRMLRLAAVPVWVLLAACLASPAFGQSRASPAAGLAPSPGGPPVAEGARASPGLGSAASVDATHAWLVPRTSPGPAPPSSVGSASFAADGLPAAWWRGWRDHFALRHRGIEYRDEFVFHRQHLRLRISGPVVKGSPGLRVDLRGWAWRGTTTRFSAYGSAKRQGFKFEIEF